MRDIASLSHLEPQFKFIVGINNVFGSSPKYVLEHNGRNVRVVCVGGEIVVLDFEDLAASKETPEGRFFYKGGLDQSNDALGYMRAI